MKLPLLNKLDFSKYDKFLYGFLLGVVFGIIILFPTVLVFMSILDFFFTFLILFMLYKGRTLNIDLSSPETVDGVCPTCGRRKPGRRSKT